MLGLALSNRYLIAQLVKRELTLKYTGSVLGGLWVVVTPLIMLSIYSLFFTVVIKAKWGDAGFESDAFALLLFAGLLLHSFFAEILTSTPQLVVSNPNYVKKAVFPVEVLAIVQTLAAALGLAACAPAVYTQEDLREEERRQAAEDRSRAEAKQEVVEQGGAASEEFETELEELEAQSDR